MPTTPRTPAPAANRAATVATTRQVRPGWWRSAHRLTLRALQPPDAPLLLGLYEGLSPQSRRQRFHGMVRPSPATVAGLCRVDGQRQRAWLVVDEAGEGGALHGSASETPTGATGTVHRGRALAEARLVVDAVGTQGADGRTAEFALLVDEGWRQRGLGRWVMQALMDDAAADGLVWLQGEVLDDNLAMLQLLRACGFALCPHPQDAGLLLAQRRLVAPGAVANAAPGVAAGVSTGAVAGVAGVAAVVQGWAL